VIESCFVQIRIPQILCADLRDKVIILKVVVILLKVRAE